MSSIPLNHLLKIGAEALETTAQTLSGAINELKAAIQTVAGNIPTISVGHTGTASGSAVRKQQITVDNTAVDIDGTVYMELTQDIHATNGNIFTFNNAAITSNSMIDWATSNFAVQPESISAANGTCVVTVPAADSSQNLTVRIYIK